MGGNTKLVIQDKKGKVHNLLPMNYQISEWFVNSKFDSKEEKVRTDYLKEILKEWSKEKKELEASKEKLDKMTLKSCLNSAPEGYGICFVSYKHNILMNIQYGSSVNLVVNGHVQPKEEVPKLWNFKETQKGSALFHIRHVNWTVIESIYLDEKLKPIAKAVMESCGIVFTAQENKMWAKF